MATQPSLSFGGEAGTPGEALTSSQFHILLTLAEGSCHGYGIMKKIEERTAGEVELGPGTLYRSIGQLLTRGLIAEFSQDGPPADGRLRRHYALTPAGEVQAAEEASRLRAILQWADEAMGLRGVQP